MATPSSRMLPYVVSCSNPRGGPQIVTIITCGHRLFSSILQRPCKRNFSRSASPIVALRTLQHQWWLELRHGLCQLSIAIWHSNVLSDPVFGFTIVHPTVLALVVHNC